jgi:hypothetical protein
MKEQMIWEEKLTVIVLGVISEIFKAYCVAWVFSLSTLYFIVCDMNVQTQYIFDAK